MRRKNNYRDTEDLTKEEMFRLDHLERMVKDYEEMGLSVKATANKQSEYFLKRSDEFREELEAYKKEIGIA